MQEYSNLAHGKKIFEGDANSKEEEGCPKSSVAKLYFQFSGMFITCSQITFHGLCAEEALLEIVVV